MWLHEDITKYKTMIQHVLCTSHNVAFVESNRFIYGTASKRWRQKLYFKELILDWLNMEPLKSFIGSDQWSINYTHHECLRNPYYICQSFITPDQNSYWPSQDKSKIWRFERSTNGVGKNVSFVNSSYMACHSKEGGITNLYVSGLNKQR